MRVSKITSVILGLCALPAAVAQLPATPSAGTPPPSTLPVSAPTALPNTAMSSPAIQSTVSHPATVLWQNDRLTLVSSGTPLGDMLRQISLATGLRVRGNPANDPIYGTYGPGSLDEVVDSLLSGLPVNRLLDHTGGTATLTLTPRIGGASPASGNAAQQSDPDSEISRHPASLPDRNRYMQPGQLDPQANAAGSIPDDLQPQPRATTAPLPPSPNGVKTPEQIQQDLLRLQRQGAAPQQGVPVQP